MIESLEEYTSSVRDGNVDLKPEMRSQILEIEKKFPGFKVASEIKNLVK